VNTMPQLGIWRIVNGLDIVPRMPGARFHHVGHTLQLDRSGARAYYLHEGDVDLGYAGIPFGWNTLPYALAPVAAYGHLMNHYSDYINDKSTRDPTKFYFDGFETIKGGSQIYYNDDEGDDKSDSDSDSDSDNEDGNDDNAPPDDAGFDIDIDIDIDIDASYRYKQTFENRCAELYMDYLDAEKARANVKAEEVIRNDSSSNKNLLNESFEAKEDVKKASL